MGIRGADRRGPARIALTVLVALVLIGVFAPLLVTLLGVPGPNEIDTSSLSPVVGTPVGPDSGHLFGVDWLGRDVLSRTVYGARVSLLVATFSVVGAVALSVLIGLLAGFRGGVIDIVLSRMIEAFLVIPYLLLAVGIAATCSSEEGCLNGAVKPGVPLVIVILIITSWPVLARIIRNETLAMKERDYVAAARLSGTSGFRIVARELLPNLLPLIGVMTVVLVPQMVIAEAAFSFLGVGVPETTPSWGGMIASGARTFPQAWWLLLFPGVGLVITVLVCAVLADRLRGGRTESPGFV